MDNTMKNEVWVFIEQRNGKPADVSYELLSKGRKLADTMHGVLKAVVIGNGMKDLAVDTFRFGVDEALVIDHPQLTHYRTLPYSRILNELVFYYFCIDAFKIKPYTAVFCFHTRAKSSAWF